MTKHESPLSTEEELRIAEFALGTLQGQERRAFEERLEREARLRTALAEWQERLMPLDENADLTDPPDRLLGDIEAKIDSLGPRQATTVRADSGTWREIHPGVAVKLLYRDGASGGKSLLLRLEPGATLPAHDHSSVEECMIIEGDMVIGDLHLSTGDYHMIEAGTRHQDVTSEGGGLAFIRYAA